MYVDPGGAVFWDFPLLIAGFPPFPFFSPFWAPFIVGAPLFHLFSILPFTEMDLSGVVFFGGG